jgi:hypothetical protein
MKVSSALPRTLWQFPLLFLLWAQAGGQAIRSLESIKSQAELDKTGAALDAALFDSFNHCDLEKFGTFLTENVEFYDDRDGLSVGRQRQIEDLKNYICGKVTREIVPGTLQCSGPQMIFDKHVSNPRLFAFQPGGREYPVAGL